MRCARRRQGAHGLVVLALLDERVHEHAVKVGHIGVLRHQAAHGGFGVFKAVQRVEQGCFEGTCVVALRIAAERIGEGFLGAGHVGGLLAARLGLLQIELRERHVGIHVVGGALHAALVVRDRGGGVEKLGGRQQVGLLTFGLGHRRGRRATPEVQPQAGGEHEQPGQRNEIGRSAHGK
jgi:hypothetical protein